MVQVQRTPVRFAPDPARVILKPFLPGGRERIEDIFNRILVRPDDAIREEVDRVMERFDCRHKRTEEQFRSNYQRAVDVLGRQVHVSAERELLIGAYFTSEYSIESAAFFNPSIVPHDDQRMCAEGETHFVCSFRATGEGHVSSIVFRTGFIDADNKVRIDPVSRFLRTGRPVEDKTYNKVVFSRKLKELGFENYVSTRVLRKLSLNFTLEELEKAIYGLCDIEMASTETRNTFDAMTSLARANYDMVFDRDTHICERVIFPRSQQESRGIEDARFVRFVEDDGTFTYYATYTAVDQHTFIPQLLQTPDFIDYKIMTLNGDSVQNKGLALFPRRIGGLYMMVSRQDNENLYLMTSDSINFWEKAEPLHHPMEPWEVIQIGNCGSPLETPEGWVLLTHGVGPVRQYSIGALLLALEDPFRVIGRTRQPILVPNDEEREGYVPNVVYSCGGMTHNDCLVIPYAMSDQVSSIAFVRVDELVDEMKNGD